MKEFIEYLVKNLVDAPNDVNVNFYESEKGAVVEVKVNPLDVGKIIGRKGNTIKALRTISSMISARFGQRVKLEIIE